MVIRQSECVDELYPAMKAGKKFKIRLPHTQMIYRPVYTFEQLSVHSVIVFDPKKDNYHGRYFIGSIKKVAVLRGRYTYTVECIKRSRGNETWFNVNWLRQTFVEPDEILCKLMPETLLI